MRSTKYGVIVTNATDRLNFMNMSDSSYYDYHPTVQLARPLALGGVPGAPYREVGHHLATLTGLTLIDLDRWIEHQVGQSLWDFVREDGEEELRRKEFEYLNRALAAQPRGLIIVSEGTLAREENRRQLRESAALIYLSLSPSTMYWEVRQQISERGPRSHPHVPQPLTHFDQLRFLIDALAPAQASADLVCPMDNSSVQEVLGVLFEKLPDLNVLQHGDSADT